MSNFNLDWEKANFSIRSDLRDYEPTEEELISYAQSFGLCFPKDNHLLPISLEGLKAPIPSPWKACYTKNGDIFFHQPNLAWSVWEHPLDDFYKLLYSETKENRDVEELSTLENVKKREKARNKFYEMKRELEEKYEMKLEERKNLKEKANIEKECSGVEKNRRDQLERTKYITGIQRDREKFLERIKQQHEKKVQEIKKDLESKKEKLRNSDDEECVKLSEIQKEHIRLLEEQNKTSLKRFDVGLERRKGEKFQTLGKEEKAEITQINQTFDKFYQREIKELDEYKAKEQKKFDQEIVSMKLRYNKDYTEQKNIIMFEIKRNFQQLRAEQEEKQAKLARINTALKHQFDFNIDTNNIDQKIIKQKSHSKLKEFNSFLSEKKQHFSELVSKKFQLNDEILTLARSLSKATKETAIPSDYTHKLIEYLTEELISKEQDLKALKTGITKIGANLHQELFENQDLGRNLKIFSCQSRTNLTKEIIKVTSEGFNRLVNSHFDWYHTPNRERECKKARSLISSPLKIEYKINNQESYDSRSKFVYIQKDMQEEIEQLKIEQHRIQKDIDSVSKGSQEQKKISNIRLRIQRVMFEDLDNVNQKLENLE